MVLVKTDCAPAFVKWGLRSDFQPGQYSDSTRMLYYTTRRPEEEISAMVHEAWDWMQKHKESPHVLAHLLYVLQSEVRFEVVADIACDIMRQALESENDYVIEQAIELTEEWGEHEEILEILRQTKISINWLAGYKENVLNYWDKKEKGA